MDKPYTTVQRNDYQLTIYHGIDPLDPDNANVDVQVTFPNGESFSAVFFTLQNIDTLMKHYKKTGEGANGLYFWTSDMLIVQKLTEQTICETVDNLLAEEEFASVFSKNEESTIIAPKDGDKLFKRFNESL
jgi:hypothetical protein